MPHVGDLPGACRIILLGSKLNVLLAAVPLALISDHLRWGDGVTFALSLVGICPLAERLGYLTEQTAGHTSETIAALLNVSLGNATELIVSVFALRDGLLRVVQLSLLGSVLSNALLVLGCALAFGGAKYHQQRFDARSAGLSLQMLMLAVSVYLGPMLLDVSRTTLGPDSGLTLSRFSSCFLLVAYGCFIFFQMVTHKADFSGDAAGSDDDGEAEEEEDVELTLGASVAGLVAVTALIALLSDSLVGAIEGAAKQWSVPLAFLSVILLPIVGNAAEHASAVLFARHNRLDLAFGIALGSSVQIACFLFPALVLLAACMGAPLDLDLQPFEMGCFLVTTLLVNQAVQGGTSTWLRGVILVVAYVCMAAGYACHSDPRLDADELKKGG